MAHGVIHPERGPQPGVVPRPAPTGDAESPRYRDHAGMRSDPRLDVLQATVGALAVALRPDQAAVARAVLLAGLADPEEQVGGGADHAAAAGTMSTILGALVAPLRCLPDDH